MTFPLVLWVEVRTYVRSPVHYQKRSPLGSLQWASLVPIFCQKFHVGFLCLEPYQSHPESLLAIVSVGIQKPIGAVVIDGGNGS